MPETLRKSVCMDTCKSLKWLKSSSVLGTRSWYLDVVETIEISIHIQIFSGRVPGHLWVQSWRMHFICSHLWSGVGSVFSFRTKHQTVYVWINVPINYDIYNCHPCLNKHLSETRIWKKPYWMGIGKWIMWFIPQLPDGYTESTHAGVISNCQLSMLAWNSCSSALYIQNNNSNKNNQNNTNKKNNKQCMNVCVYVCMHACMHAWMNVYVYVCIVCSDMYVWNFMYWKLVYVVYVTWCHVMQCSAIKCILMQCNLM